MSRRTWRRAISVIATSCFVLVVGLSIAWLSGYGPLPFVPQTVIMVTMIAFCLTMLLSVTTAMAGTDFISRQKRSIVPEAPKDDIVSRVVFNAESGEERLIQGHPNSSMRELLEDDWPFRKRISKDWYLVDQNGNDVTNWPVSNWDGIATLRYRDRWT